MGLVALLLAGSARAQSPPESIDQGNYVVYLGSKAIGAENFAIRATSDSVSCVAHSYITKATPRGEETVEKQMGWSANRTDWSLRYYQSDETFRGETLVRGIVQLEGDTALTVFVENKSGGGSAVRRVAPPGRFFVLDSGLYTLFDLICLSLHGRTFVTRPLNLMSVGPPDSLFEAQVTDLGHETIRWGARPVQARKVQISDGSITFLAWMSPDRGQMLRLAHEASGLRVEREAPPVRKRPPTPSPKPGG
jgi:hypothetical protein